MTLPGMLHLAMLRSPMAHAKITSIDTTEAKGRPGVVAVYTGQDFAETQGNLPCAWPVTPDMVNPGAPSIAVDQVNLVGEIVAVIAARTKAEAQDALEGIDVEYEPAAGRPEHGGGHQGRRRPRPPQHRVEQVLHVGVRVRRGRHRRADRRRADNAEVTVKRRFIQQRLIPVVHGAALVPRAARRRGRHDVVVHADRRTSCARCSR